MTSKSSLQSPRATVDARGRFLAGDPDVIGSDSIEVPAHGRVAWQSSADGEFRRISPGAPGEWVVELLSSGVAATRPALGAESLAALTRSVDFGGTISTLSAVFAANSDTTVPIVVLIDPSGAPTFAGGTTQDYRQLAAMEQCRLASAPMAIWQAFEEERLTVDDHWVETVNTDDRFIAIRNLLPPTMSDDDDLTYVSIPLRNDRTVIGVVAAFWPASTPVTAETVERWSAAAEELALGIQFSELLRRAHATGAEAERIRMNDDIHSGLAQSIFALSLEVARASAAGAGAGKADLATIQTMADELSSDVRYFLSDGRIGGGGVDLASQLQQLTSELTAQTGAFALTDHRVTWDGYSYDFADYIVRVVTEAFRNITKHSSATHISFRSWIDTESQDVVIEIADDGRNEPRTLASSAGVGLALIRELTARWQGSVRFETTDQGAALTIRAVPEYQSEWAVAQRILRAGSDGQ